MEREFLSQLSWIYESVPDAATQVLARLRRQRRAPLLQVLIRGILSHQTTSTQARLASERLWARYKTIDRLASADPGRIEGLIRNVGLGRTKARRLVAIAQDIKERWGGDRHLARYLRSAPIEDARQALLELPGVGPKTAAVVLLFRFQRPTFPVDTNILRVAKELGWVPKSAHPEDVRRFVERRLPKDPVLHLRAHACLIALGRATQRGRRRDILERLRGQLVMMRGSIRPTWRRITRPCSETR